MAGVPTVASAPPKLVVAGVKTAPSTLTSASSDFFDGVRTLRRPTNLEPVPVVGHDLSAGSANSVWWR